MTQRNLGKQRNDGHLSSLGLLALTLLLLPTQLLLAEGGGAVGFLCMLQNTYSAQRQIRRQSNKFYLVGFLFVCV